MSAATQTILAGQVEAAAQAAGLVIAAATPAVDFSGNPTTQFTLALAAEPSKTQLLELSDTFDFSRADLLTQVQVYLAEAAKRLRNPRSDLYLTLHGIPLSFGRFVWPFHQSTSGADTSLVHGEVRLESGEESILHAKISASMTVTFREIVAAPEQPFAEGFIYNAVRKTMDQGQLELVKSGNRQPVPVTTRYYSSKQKKFIFNDTTEAQRREFLQAKTFWISGIVGGGAPVWLLDPRDAQYLNATLADLKESVDALVAIGAIQLTADAEYATATAALMGQKSHYDEELAHSLGFIKPSFNEDMRGGLTNM
jgi:hypothetical protein